MYTALIVAAGKSERMGGGQNKNLLLLKGKPLICHSVDCFLEDSDCQEIIVVCPEHEMNRFREVLPENITCIPGGNTRQASVLCGLESVSHAHVFIHDGARPCFHELMDRLKSAIITHEAVVPAIRFPDTIARVEQDVITADDDRESVRKIQTPQVFVTDLIRQAHLQAQNKNTHYTDDQTLYRHEMHREVHVVDGSEANIKATTHIDMMILEALL